MLKKIVILLVLPLVFWSCKESGLNLKVRYDQIEGLKEGDRVISKQNHIGKVAGVSYSEDGYYMADLAMKKDLANAATEHSRFLIIADPQNREKKAIEMIQARKGGAPLQNGAIVDGSARSLPFFNKVRDDFEKGLQDLKKRFEQFSEDLGSVPESEEFKKLEKELERMAEEIKRSGKSARKKIQKELLPWLQQEIEKLRKHLRKFGREKELEPLEIQMKRITEI